MIASHRATAATPENTSEIVGLRIGEDESRVAEGFAPLLERGTGTRIGTLREEVADFLCCEKCVEVSILA